MTTPFSTVRWLLISGTVFFSTVAFGFHDKKVDFSVLESANLQFLSRKNCQETYIAIEREFDKPGKAVPSSLMSGTDLGLSTDLLRWVPTGAPERHEDRSCSPQVIEKLFLSNSSSTTNQAERLKGFFNRCDSVLRWDSPNGLNSLLSLASTRYNICDHPNIRKFIMRMPDGELVRGALAVKPGNTPRPLIIVKCGVLCDAGGSAMRFLLMHLFDESPFHVLALANVTGTDFVRDNGYVAFGGFHEGQQILHAAKVVRSGPLSKLVSSIHFVGVSLGSQGGLYAAYMNRFNSNEGESPLLQSTFATCPVVDLETSIRSIFSSRLSGFVAKLFFFRAVRGVLDFLPELQPLFPSPSVDAKMVPDVMAKAATEHYRKLGVNWALPPFENTVIRTSKEFWERNQFLNIAHYPFSTPTLVFAGEDDLVVPTEANALKLGRDLSRIASKTSKGLEFQNNLAAVTIPSGNHCAFSQIYGWRITSSIYRSYVLSHSPEMLSLRKGRRTTLPKDTVSQASRLFSQERYELASFRFEAGRPLLHLTIKIFVPHAGQTCRSRPSIYAPDYCFREISIEVPFKRLTERPTWARTPTTQAEAESLTRWANVNLTLLDRENRPIEGDTHAPVKIHWQAYGE